MSLSETANKGRRRLIRGIKIAPYLFILPFLSLLGIFVIYPVLYGFYLSLHKWILTLGGEPIFIFFGNYKKLLYDSLFWISLRNTFYYTIGTVPGLAICSLGLALVMNKKLKFRALFRTIYYIPVIVSMVVIALVWKYMFDPYGGIANTILSRLGLKTQYWLVDPNWAMPIIIITSIWKQLGYYMVIFLAGLQGIPAQLYEAARIDGAGKWDCFRYITVPLLMPVTLFVFIIATIGSFQVFDQVYIMTEGGPGHATMTLVQHIYYQAFKYFSMGYSSALSYTLFMLILAFTLIQLKFFGREIEP